MVTMTGGKLHYLRFMLVQGGRIWLRDMVGVLRHRCLSYCISNYKRTVINSRAVQLLPGSDVASMSTRGGEHMINLLHPPLRNCKSFLLPCPLSTQYKD